MYEQISEDTLKELFKIWKVKNIEELKDKSSNTSLVSFKFYKLPIESKNIIYYLIKNSGKESKELSSMDIAYSLNYSQKHLPIFYNSIEDIKNSGLIYVKMRRRRLNSGDDILYFTPNVKEIIENIILEEPKVTNYTDIQYNATIYKKYLKNIISLYENDKIFEKSKSKISDEDLSVLCKANIFCVYFYGKDFNPYIGINNNKVIEKIEKSFDENIYSSTFIYNHLNILNDIETLLYEADIQKLNIDDINVKFLSFNTSSNVIINICLKLDLIRIDNRGFILLEYDNIKNYLKEDIEERIEIILKSFYKNYSPYHKKILKILERNGIISKSKLFLELKEKKEKYDIILNTEDYNNILYSMFLLGLLEAAFYENAIISLKNVYYNKDNSNKKCFINGNFEITLINHNLFSNDFIYMCNLYFELDNNETVYTYTMTEDKILQGKTMINNPDSKYSFYNFLNILKETLKNNSINIPKHIETNLKRWYERGTISSIYENVTIINIKNANKIDEIIYEAKRKGINIIKLNEEYCMLKSNSISKKNLIKFLRHKKIIITF